MGRTNNPDNKAAGGPRKVGNLESLDEITFHFQSRMAMVGAEIDPLVTTTLLGVPRSYPPRLAAIKRVNDAFLSIYQNLAW